MAVGLELVHEVLDALGLVLTHELHVVHLVQVELLLLLAEQVGVSFALAGVYLLKEGLRLERATAHELVVLASLLILAPPVAIIVTAVLWLERRQLVVDFSLPGGRAHNQDVFSAGILPIPLILDHLASDYLLFTVLGEFRFDRLRAAEGYMRREQLFDPFTLGATDTFCRHIEQLALLCHHFVARVQVVVDEKWLFLQIGRRIHYDVAALVSLRDRLALVRALGLDWEQVCRAELLVLHQTDHIVLVRGLAWIDQATTLIANVLPVLVQIADELHELVVVELLLLPEGCLVVLGRGNLDSRPGALLRR